MLKFCRLLGQVVSFILFGLMLGYFSNSPSYTYHDSEKALIMVSFSHSSERKEKCRRFTPEEIAATAANMRRSMDCKRERVPVYVELMLDNESLLSKSYNPTGLAKDGSASVYERISVEPGKHHLIVKLRDSGREEGFDYESDSVINIEPKELFVIDFRKDLGGFYFQ